jgi:hypothetical protein
VIIQQERNEATTPSNDQLVAAVVNRQGCPESPLAFKASAASNHLVFHDLSDILKRVLQELPKTQKEVVHFASKGISRREIAAISLATKTMRHLLA